MFKNYFTTAFRNIRRSFSYLFDAKLIGGYILLFILTGLLSGFYPALILSGYNPVETLYSRFSLKGKNHLQRSSSLQFDYETVDESYLPLMKIPIVKGRNFSKDHPGDAARSILVNESFVQKAGWRDPIGETVNFFYNNNEMYTVIGVVKDYHNKALDQKIGPQMFTMKKDNLYGLYAVKIKPGAETQVLNYLQQTFKQFYPLHPYNYVFKDQQKLKAYQQEAKWKQIILFGAVLTIFISCIGLFGLSVLSAEKRTKEIGIRKVLGASVNGLVGILSRDFLKLVCIALAVAIPAAWMASDKWLQHYPYRITLSWWLFAIAALLVIMIALLTVSFQAVKAAVANPVKSLRSE